MNRKIRSTIALVILCLLVIPGIKSQEIKEQVKVGDVWEEVSLITDRQLYLSGEKIWFSANCSVSSFSVDKQMSNVLYVELYQGQQAVVQKKFQIIEGAVQGMIEIPEEIHSANYYLRAYTQYMRNFLADTYFTTLLSIVNPDFPYRESKTRPLKLMEAAIEGGQLFDGLPAKIAVKLNPNLVSIVEESWFQDQYKSTIRTFELASNGLTLIEFTPADSLNYTFAFRLNTGDTVTQPLPKSSHKGISISENLKYNEVGFYTSPEYRIINESNHILQIFSVKGKQEIELSVTIDRPDQNISVDAKQLEPGLHYLLLFNSKGEATAYSTFYNSTKQETLSINLQTQKEVFDRRAAVQLTLSQMENMPIIDADLTVSVVKKGTAFHSGGDLPLFCVDNLRLLPAFADQIDLESSGIQQQLKAIQTLNNVAADAQQVAQRFETATINKTSWLPETREVSVSGILRNKTNKQLLADVWVYASVLGPDAQFHAYKTRENGLFIFSLNKLHDTHDLSLTIDSIPGVDAEFLIYNDFSDNWSDAVNISLRFDSCQQSLLENMLVNKQVTQLFKQKETIHKQAVDSLPFPFTDVQASVDLKDFVALPTMTEVLNELVSYVHVRKRDGNHILAVVDQNRKNVYDHPLILIDNLPVFNVDEILAINPAKVERIDVIGKVYGFGDLLIEGIIMITTKTDDFAGIQLPSASVFVEYQTITPSASVQFPVYDPQNESPGHSPDFKNLLYWNPSVSLTENDATITFFTADEITDYEIIVSGKTEDGRAVFGRHEISVQSK